jgi:hypothetical protein
MSSDHAAREIAQLRELVFGAVESWNAAHPHPLRSRHERGSVSVAHVYGTAGGPPSYAIRVECALSGTPQLSFRGTNLAAVAEQARLTLEHKLEVELRRRAGSGRYETHHRHGIAV